MTSDKPPPRAQTGLLYPEWGGGKKEREILEASGGLVLDCITTISGVQSVIAECSCIFVFTSSHKRKSL